MTKKNGNYGKWKMTGKRLLNHWEKYVSDMETARAEFPTPRGAVDYNKKRVPHLGYFVNKYLKVARTTFDRWCSKEWIMKYEDTPDNKSYNAYDFKRAKALYDAATFVRESCLSTLENGLANGEGHAQGIMFNIKNNWGKDPARHVEQNTDQEVKVTIVDARSRGKQDIPATDKGVSE